MICDDVLLLFLPPKLFFFKVSYVFDFFAFTHESLMSLAVDFLKILNILLALGLSMVINLERTLRPHEIWVSIAVVSV